MALSLTPYSYLLASLSFGVLAALLLLSDKGKTLRLNLLLCASITSVWGLSASIHQLPTIIMDTGELAKNACWCFLLLKILNLNSLSSNLALHWRKAFLYTLLIVSMIALLQPQLATLLATRELLPLQNLVLPLSRDLALVCWLLMAITGLWLIEQIFRNTLGDQRWSIKYLCIGIGSLFAYDFFMYADALLFKQLNPALWQARGFINAMAAPLIAVSIARNPNWAIDIHVSRQAVFHSVTLVGTGIYLTFMAAAGYALRFYGGQWGGVFQIAFLFGSLVLLASLLFSDKIRTQAQVLLNKHFFSYQYDYREQWKTFSQRLAAPEGDTPTRVCEAMAALVHSPGALLWIQQGCLLELHAHWQMAPKDIDDQDSLAPLTYFYQERKWIIDIDDYLQHPQAYPSLTLPVWLLAIPERWLLIPLWFQQGLQGLLLLKRSNLHPNINWEDRDLLKMAGQQAAGHLAQHQADRQLMAARQFEAFNRLSTYVMHDLKNILAQQSLIVSNAVKHKHKPAFIDDVLSTVENSVARMTRLMSQMRSGMRAQTPQSIQLISFLPTVIKQHQQQKPSPQLELAEDNASSILVEADQEQLATVFSHLIKNAQEATPDEGLISLRLAHTPGQAIVTVLDTGSGMSADFIRLQLFAPFVSTKGLTGMGIGVFESRSVIRSLGGDILVDSEPNNGSRFEIRLPCSCCKQNSHSGAQKIAR